MSLYIRNYYGVPTIIDREQGPVETNYTPVWSIPKGDEDLISKVLKIPFLFGNKDLEDVPNYEVEIDFEEGSWVLKLDGDTKFTITSLLVECLLGEGFFNKISKTRILNKLEMQYIINAIENNNKEINKLTNSNVKLYEKLAKIKEN